MEIGNEISQKIRSAIKAKLIELGAYVDDELPDYIMVMVANKKTQKQMSNDLSLFLSHNTDKFTVWLQSLLKKLQSINSGSEPSTSKHKSKEKHKGEKRKHRTSQSENSGKTGEPEKKKATTDKPATKHASEEETKTDVSRVTEDEKALPAIPATDEEPGAEINISENTDEFNEENKEIEKKSESTKSSSTGKPPPAKVTKPKKSSEEPSSSSKTSSRRHSSGKSVESTSAEKPTSAEKQSGSHESRKKPSSAVVAVKRKYEELDDAVDEEYDPTNPAVGSVASVIRGPTRKSSVPKSLQANRSLLMKAVSDAEKSVTTAKKTDHIEKEETKMRSDRKPVDLSRRLKTAAGLKLISRSKRKELENLTYTVSNPSAKETTKRRQSSGDGQDKMQFTVKNDSATTAKISPKQKGLAVASSRMAASAIKDISKQVQKVNPVGIKRESSPDGNGSEQDDDEDERSSANSLYESDESSVVSSGESESDGEEELESGDEDESEEIEIEVTDRAAQTELNMRDKNVRCLVKSKQRYRNAEVQTDVVEFDVDECLTYRLTKDKVEDIDRNLLHLFIDNTVSVDFVENEAFKVFAKSLEPKYHFPKRKKLMTQIGMLYNRMKGNLKADLAGAEFVTITHNVWSSVATKKYHTVSVYFITKDWQLKSAVLKTTTLTGENIEEELAQNLEEVRVLWNLNKPVALTEDSELEETVFEMLGWKRVTCFGTCILEIMQSCLHSEEICEFLGNGRDLIAELQRNSQVVDVFEEKKRLLLPKELHSVKLVTDDRMDWSSTLTMISNLRAQSPALHAAVMDNDLTAQGVDLRSQMYNFKDQSTLESLVKIAKLFKTAIELLTNSEAPTHQKIMPIFAKLKTVLDEDQDDSEMIKRQKAEIKAQVEMFLSKNRATCLLACVVHPQTKQMAFVCQEDKDRVKKLLFEDIKEQFEKECNVDSAEEEEDKLFKKGKRVNQRQTKAMSEIAEQIDPQSVVVKNENKDAENEESTDTKGTNTEEDESVDQKSPKPSTSETENDDTEESKKRQTPVGESSQSKISSSLKHTDLSISAENDWLDDVICAAEEKKTPEELAKVELDLYMAEPASSKNPLEWWREKQLVYPKISQVARRFLAIPASSLSARDVFRFQRQSELKINDVKPEHIDMMVFLKKNWNLYD